MDVAYICLPHRLVFHSVVAFFCRTDGKAKRKTKTRVPSRSLFLIFLSSNWKTQGAPSNPPYKRLNSLFSSVVVSLSPFICWINHFTPVINKWTNGWMSIPSNYWFTDVYFLRENSMKHFNYVFFLFLPLSPSSWIFFFCKKRRIPLRLIPTQHHRHCNKTLEFRETTHINVPAPCIHVQVQTSALLYFRGTEKLPCLDVVESTKIP